MTLWCWSIKITRKKSNFFGHRFCVRLKMFFVKYSGIKSAASNCPIFPNLRHQIGGIKSAAPNRRHQNGGIKFWRTALKSKKTRLPQFSIFGVCDRYYHQNYIISKEEFKIQSEKASNFFIDFRIF